MFETARDFRYPARIGVSRFSQIQFGAKNVMKAKFPPPAPRELVVIVDPRARIRVKNGQVIALNPNFADDAQALANLVASEQVVIWPLYGVSEESLLEKTAATKRKMGVGQRLDLSIFYKITAPDQKFKSLVPKFRQLKVVQAAYIKPGVELTIMDNSIEFRDGIAPGPTTGDLTPKQVYLNSVSEGGLGVPCAWARKGGKGAGINIIDAEGAWRFSHEDLPANQGGLIGGAVFDDLGWRNHGTAVLGVIGGDNNTFGVTGICPDALVSTVSVFGTTGGPLPVWSAAAAIVRAADVLNKGDIVLIEHHLPGRRADFEIRDDQVGYIPIEWWPCNLAAIQYAVDQGIIVIAAAGNGQQNLDDPIYDDDPEGVAHGPFPDWWSNPFQRDPIDSGAIVVGAGMPPKVVAGTSTEQDRSRVRESNFGRMVDAQGWGDRVVTCGYGGLSPNEPNEDRWYTSRFNGTSSAAAMVAGAVGCLQGILRDRGTVIDALNLRTLLRDDQINSKQEDGDFGMASAARIGPRPNLCRLIDHLIPPPPGFMERIASFVRTVLRRFS